MLIAAARSGACLALKQRPTLLLKEEDGFYHFRKLGPKGSCVLAPASGVPWVGSLLGRDMLGGGLLIHPAHVIHNSTYRKKDTTTTMGVVVRRKEEMETARCSLPRCVCMWDGWVGCLCVRLCVLPPLAQGVDCCRICLRYCPVHWDYSTGSRSIRNKPNAALEPVSGGHTEQCLCSEGG